MIKLCKVTNRFHSLFHGNQKDNNQSAMDEKPIFGFLAFLVVGVGVIILFTAPINTWQVCLGNLLGLALMAGGLRLHKIRQWIIGPNSLQLLALLLYFILGLLFTFSLGRLAMRL
jgi:hypothetical protein